MSKRQVPLREVLAPTPTTRTLVCQARSELLSPQQLEAAKVEVWQSISQNCFQRLVLEPPESPFSNNNLCQRLMELPELLLRTMETGSHLGLGAWHELRMPLCATTSNLVNNCRAAPIIIIRPRVSLIGADLEETLETLLQCTGLAPRLLGSPRIWLWCESNPPKDSSTQHTKWNRPKGRLHPRQVLIRLVESKGLVPCMAHQPSSSNITHITPNTLRIVIRMRNSS